MPYGYRGLKIFTPLTLRFQDFQRQQRGFSAAIAPDNADGFAFFDFKGNVFQGPEFAEILFRALPGQTLQARGDKLLKPVARIVVDLIAFAEVLYFDGDAHSGYTP